MQQYTASMLRRELSERALIWAKQNNLLHDISPGQNPAVLFGRDDAGRHGNFHPRSYQQICANTDWSKRLDKAHTASRREWLRASWLWRELDTANSSDALLMTIFCHPDIVTSDGLIHPVAQKLGVDSSLRPVFGLHPKVPFKNGRLDRTEVDMQLGDLLVEAKLTESSFQFASLKLIERYRDLEGVFDVTSLPWTSNGVVQGYQLIRNVLACYSSNTSFCVLCDERRRDLIETWYAVMSAVHQQSFRWRLKLLTWQELLPALPSDLLEFLTSKYGFA